MHLIPIVAAVVVNSVAVCMLNPFHSGYQSTGILANIQDSDEIRHNATFHQGLHCLLT